MRRDLPQQWAKELERQAPPIHSLRQLALKLSLSVSTASRLVHGEPVSEDTIEAAVEALGITTDEVHRLRGEPPRRPFVLPRDADRLTERQRQAVLSVVRAMLEPAETAAPKPQESRPPLRRVARRPATPKEGPRA